MRNPDPLYYMIRILEWIEDLKVFMSKGDFLSEPLVRDACLRKLEILSDCTVKIPQAVKDEMPSIDWKGIKGFRNILAHEYEFGIDYVKVLDIIRNDIPVLEKELREYMDKQ